ncbi:MAG: RNA 2'-phosphotransferase [Bacteroidota bacterium]
MKPPQLTRLGRKISLVLRHKPKAIGLTLDEHGWADVAELLEKMTASGTPLDRAGLDRIVAENNKQRFRYSDDGRLIRANQGHSIDVDLELEAVPPPAILYHGTASTSVASILATGLESRSRQHVHLSADTETAVMVGKRHGKPVVLRVDARAMAADGHQFYRSENGVWLAAAVPPQYLARD